MYCGHGECDNIASYCDWVSRFLGLSHDYFELLVIGLKCGFGNECCSDSFVVVEIGCDPQSKVGLIKSGKSSKWVLFQDRLVIGCF